MSLEELEKAKKLRDELSNKLAKINDEATIIDEEAEKIEDKNSGFYLDKQEKLRDSVIEYKNVAGEYENARKEFERLLDDSKQELVSKVNSDMKLLDENRNEEVRNAKINELNNRQVELQQELDLVDNKISSLKDYLGRVKENEFYTNMYQGQLDNQIEKQKNLLKEITENKHQLELLTNGNVENTYMELQSVKLDIEKNFSESTYMTYMSPETEKKDIEEKETAKVDENEKDTNKETTKKEKIADDIEKTLRKNDLEERMKVVRADQINRIEAQEKARLEQEEKNKINKKKKISIKSMFKSIGKFFGKIKQKIIEFKDTRRLKNASKLLLESAEAGIEGERFTEDVKLFEAAEKIAKTSEEKRKQFLDELSQDIDAEKINKIVELNLKQEKEKRQIKGVKKEQFKKYIGNIKEKRKQKKIKKYKAKLAELEK